MAESLLPASSDDTPVELHVLLYPIPLRYSLLGQSPHSRPHPEVKGKRNSSPHEECKQDEGDGVAMWVVLEVKVVRQIVDVGRGEAGEGLEDGG